MTKYIAGLVLFLLVGLIGFEAYHNYANTGYVSPLAPYLALLQKYPESEVAEAPRLRRIVLGRCKKQKISSLQNQEYLKKLFSPFADLVQITEAGSINTTKAEDLALIYPLDFTPNNTNSGCWLAYIGSTQGTGQIAFEDHFGNIKTLLVRNFPVPNF